MTLRVYIDDIRDPPDSTWATFRTSEEALSFLRGLYGAFLGAAGYSDIGDTGPVEIDVISFDHDLGGNDTTRPVMSWLCEYGFWPAEVLVHSSNPVGKSWLLGMADQYAPEEVSIPQIHRTGPGR